MILAMYYFGLAIWVNSFYRRRTGCIANALFPFFGGLRPTISVFCSLLTITMNHHDCSSSHMVTKSFSTIDMSTLFCLPNLTLYSFYKLDNDKWPQQSYTPMCSSNGKESLTVTIWRGITMKANRAQHSDNSFWKIKAVRNRCTWTGAINTNNKP